MAEKRKLRVPIYFLKSLDGELFNDYRDKVIYWWNRMAILSLCPLPIKCKQLYLHGEPNSGKTFLISWILSNYFKYKKFNIYKLK